MKHKNSTKTICLEIKQDTEHRLLDEFKQLKAEKCCSNTSIYEISYNHITRKWLICNQCVELDFFKDGIKEKVRIVS